MDVRKVFGGKGEDIAQTFLKQKGYTIVERNFSARTGEIDLICLDNDEIVFVEVKTRRTTEYGYPEESVDDSKLNRIAHTAEIFLSKKKWGNRPHRIDVISINLQDIPPSIMHFESVDMPDQAC